MACGYGEEIKAICRKHLGEALQRKRQRDEPEEMGHWLTRNNRRGGPICWAKALNRS